MAVKLAGEHSSDASREVVWEALFDPEVLARTLPGCERLEKEDDGAMSGDLNVKVGPVQGKFSGRVTMSDVVAPESYRLTIDGKGPAGFLKGDGRVELADGEAGGTLLRYEVDAQVGGRIASVGQRLLDSSARVITRQALEGLDRQLEARAGAAAAAAAAGEGGEGADGETGASPSGAEAPPAPEAPSQAEFAGRFARDLIAELIPPAARPWLIAGGLLLLVAIVFLLIRGCG